MTFSGPDEDNPGTRVLKNLLGLTDARELATQEERLSKIRACELFDNGRLNSLEVGSYQGLSTIHHELFQDIYSWAGQLRTSNIAKSQIRFAPVMYLKDSVLAVSTMPQDNFDHVVEKYVEMNIAHPFREGNGRSARIWLDCILKRELRHVVDWSKVDKDDYLMAMERSPIKDTEIKAVLHSALTDNIDDRETYMKGIDHSYYYEGYSQFTAQKQARTHHSQLGAPRR